MMCSLDFKTYDGIFSSDGSILIDIWVKERRKSVEHLSRLSPDRINERLSAHKSKIIFNNACQLHRQLRAIAQATTAESPKGAF